MKTGGMDESLRRAMIAFHGRIVASATHEIQNHLAVIKEYSGLAGDLLASGKVDAGQARARGTEINWNISERAFEAAELVDMLNRFTHRADAEICSFDPNEALEELVALLKRHAGARRISLFAQSGDDTAPFRGNPSLLQYLVCSLLEPFLCRLPENSSVAISAVRDEQERLVISISADAAMDDSLEASGQGVPEPGLLEYCLDRLDCSVQQSSTTSGLPGMRVILRPLTAG
ncbi:MAG: HAMP domain-containing histidine kinase [Thermoleophilia bacterium]|nr:HAMP domain-containing histidine kinase [Thermoleophilia bacterium]